MAQKILGPIGEKINIISLFQIVEKIDDHGQRLQCIGGGNQLFYFILFYFSVVVTFAVNQSYSLDLFTFLYHTSFLCILPLVSFGPIPIPPINPLWGGRDLYSVSTLARMAILVHVQCDFSDSFSEGLQWKDCKRYHAGTL